MSSCRNRKQNLNAEWKVFVGIVVLITTGISLLILPYSCYGPPTESGKVTRKDASNMAFLYDPTSVTLHTECAVWHNGDSISALYVGIPASEFLFNQANPKGEFLTQVKFRYELYRLSSGKNNRKLADSASYVYNLQRDRLRGYFFTTILFRCSPGEKYTLRLITYDLMRKKTNQNFILVDKSSENPSQNFMAFSPSGQVPVLRNWITGGKPFLLKLSTPGYKEVVVDYYYNDQPLPRPLYTQETEKIINSRPDSTWILPLGDTFLFSMKYKGMYNFRVDTTMARGFTLLNPGDNFPEIHSATGMVNPLAYITNSNEQRNLENSENKKMAIDNFWIACGSNMQIARELIKVYYNRVTFSNVFFTSDREGWKTDRGMIYIVYGPPGNLYKTDDTEEWVYFPEAGKKVNFIFTRQSNRFSDNVYILQRSLEPSPFWRQAVDSWRSGKVFLAD